MALAPRAATPPRKGYRINIKPPHDNEARRNRLTRWVNLLATMAVVIAGPVLFCAYWGSFVGSGSTKFMILVGIGIAALLAPLVLRRMLVSNPEWAAYVTLDPFRGQNIPYGPGLHPTHWWEERNKSGNYSLEVVTKTFSVGVQTKTAQVVATGMFEYQVDLAGITNFIGIDESTIDTGFTGYIQAYLTEKFADKTAEEARASINSVNDDLGNEFMGIEDDTGDTVADFEQKYGLRTVSVVVSGLKLPEAVQKARDAIDEGRQMHAIIAATLGIEPAELTARVDDGRISKAEFAEYRREAMALSDNATMEYKRVDGNVGATVADALTGGNTKK